MKSLLKCPLLVVHSCSSQMGIRVIAVHFSIDAVIDLSLAAPQNPFCLIVSIDECTALFLI